MNPHFMLTFGTVTGRSRTLRVSHANRNITDIAISNAMTALISSQSVAGSSGRINSARRASLIETSIVPIDIE